MLTDRRNHLRHCPDVDVMAWLRPAKGANPQLTQVHNLSAGGLGLFLESQGQLDAEVSVELIRRSEHYARVLSARVAHTEQCKDGRWLVGLALQRALNDDDLRDLVPHRDTDPRTTAAKIQSDSRLAGMQPITPPSGEYPVQGDTGESRRRQF